MRTVKFSLIVYFVSMVLFSIANAQEIGVVLGSSLENILGIQGSQGENCFITSPFATSASTSVGPVGRVATVSSKIAGTPKILRFLRTAGKTLGPGIRYENLDFDDPDFDADVYGGSLNFIYDFKHSSFGALFLYDYFDFDDADDLDSINQYGLVFFLNHDHSLSKKWVLTLFGDVSYFFDRINIDHDTDDDINTFGVGGGVSVSYLGSKVIPTVGISYHYANDDSDINDYHLVKVGLNLAILFSQKSLLSLYGVWNADLTDYYDDEEEYYGDLGIELSFLLHKNWNFVLGYKKVVDLEDFDSDQIYLGTMWRW